MTDMQRLLRDLAELDDERVAIVAALAARLRAEPTRYYAHRAPRCSRCGRTGHRRPQCRETLTLEVGT